MSKIKRVSVLGMLLSEKIEKAEQIQNTFNELIPDFEAIVNNVIIPLLNNYQDMGYQFNLNSPDNEIKEQSKHILETMIGELRGFVSSSPDFFRKVMDECPEPSERIEYACFSLCLIILKEYSIKELFDLG